MDKNFNIIISGVGGQGLITLVKIITEAAFVEGLDVKSSELHGLSQRGGSVLTHIRFGKKVYSPLVEADKADLIIGLELLEGLRALSFGNKETDVLVNKYSLPIFGGLPKDEIIKKLNENLGKKLHLVSASDICKEKLGKEVASGIYLLGHAASKNLISIKKESFLQAIKNVIPEKYLELNIKAFNLA
ncbi:MAG: indolepyruvate oxidoreductase subunit beta, partial [Candidatus Staskawiczbacteria bacterium]|nr:indolepyruvate oxidoreductase subunit beta [Candidatus Staskawiczbacteria bacterium]